MRKGGRGTAGGAAELTMGTSLEDETSSMEGPSENGVKQRNTISVGNSERLADQFLMLGLPLESEVCGKKTCKVLAQ